MSTGQLSEKAIFDVARKIQPEDARLEYLKRVCGDDRELFDRVVALVRVHDQQQYLLKTSLPILPPTLGSSSQVEIGTCIGPYTLVELIGAGGMGLVYLAQQESPVRRRVALKLIKPGMDSAQVVARFEMERQALALMDHPNIARVLDGGTTETGVPFFVMDLVRGVPITEFCDQRGMASRPRLELFILVCQAVHHAHQKGVIHRDIKPSNVLITLHDGTPVPKVIDFGVAKALYAPLTNEAPLTGFTQLVGTPLYMSPEQAEMSGPDIDTRSDVYSLGVLLYELLTGLLPFDRERLRGASLDEVRRIIREEEAPRPSTRISTLDAAAVSTISQHQGIDARQLSSQLRGELDWIVMKALEKDRTRRYESAHDLARDIQRYLNNELVEARPSSRIYRIQKFARRNRVTLMAACAVSLALMVGAGVAGWQAVIATQERNEADRQRQIAQENFQRARDAVDEYLTSVSESQLLNSPGLQPLRKDLLQLALKYYQQFVNERRDDLQLRAELAGAYQRVGEITSQIGSQQQARESYRHARQILKELLAEDPANVKLRAGLASVTNRYGLLLEPAGRKDEALACYQEAFTILEQLVAAHPEVLDYRHALAGTHHNLGVWQQQKGSLSDALASLEKAVALSEGLLRQAPDVPEYRQFLANHQQQLATVRQVMGHLQEALPHAKQALEIREALVEQNREVLAYQEALATACHQLGGLQYQLGDTQAALDSQQRGTRILQQLADENPRVSGYPCKVSFHVHAGLAWRASELEVRLLSVTGTRTPITLYPEPAIAGNPACRLVHCDNTICLLPTRLRSTFR